MDEYDYLTDSQWDLYDRMSAISDVSHRSWSTPSRTWLLKSQ